MWAVNVFGLGLVVGSVVGLSVPLIQYPIQPQKVVSSGDFSIPVHDEVEVTVDGKPQRLHLTGAGLRKKTVFLFTADVYVAANYMGDQGGFAKQLGEGLDVVRKAKTKAIVLTFVRDVKGSQIRSSFEDALKENGIDLKSPPIKELFEKLTFDLPAKSTLSFVASSANPSEDIVTIEGPKEKFTLRGPKLAASIWSMWFGASADGGLSELKGQLMGASVDQ